MPDLDQQLADPVPPSAQPQGWRAKTTDQGVELLQDAQEYETPAADEEEVAAVLDENGEAWPIPSDLPATRATVRVLREAPIHLQYPEYEALVVGNDWSAAINAAIDALPQPTGGTIYTGPGSFFCVAEVLDFAQKRGVTIQGDGSTRDPGFVGATNLVIDAGGTDPRLDFDRAKDITLKDLSILYINTGLTGHPFYFGDLGGAGIDATCLTLDGVAVRGTNHQESGIFLDNCHTVVLRNAAFFNLKKGVHGPETAGRYAIGVRLEGRCFFQNQTDADLYNPDEDWSSHGTVHEPLTSGGIVAAKQSAARAARAASHANLVTSLAVYGGWIGDMSAASSVFEHDFDSLILQGVRMGLEAANGKGVLLKKNGTHLDVRLCPTVGPDTAALIDFAATSGQVGYVGPNPMKPFPSGGSPPSQIIGAAQAGVTVKP